jgi:hypothetical protein
MAQAFTMSRLWIFLQWRTVRDDGWVLLKVRRRWSVIYWMTVFRMRSR